MMFIIMLLVSLVVESHGSIVVSTWAFTDATDAAWMEMQRPTATSLDLVEAGCSTCERDQCDGTVGWGGSPDENGETTLDAMIMCGTNMEAGAVASLRQIPDAIAVARAVMQATQHTMLAGSQATDFAINVLGMTPRSLQSPRSKSIFDMWRNEYNCQPNYWMKSANVIPDASSACGPYRYFRPDRKSFDLAPIARTYTSHDTISMVAIHGGHVASGTSTNGAVHKIPGRVGDGPIVGSGSYADSEVGGCGSTGDGDIMMRFLPCYQTVENMRNGMSPTDAARDAISRIAKKFPKFSGAVVAVNIQEEHGAATHGFQRFPYSYRSLHDNETHVVTVVPHIRITSDLQVAEL